jgi:hypothetical protein
MVWGVRLSSPVFMFQANLCYAISALWYGMASILYDVIPVLCGCRLYVYYAQMLLWVPNIIRFCSLLQCSSTFNHESNPDKH